MIDFATDVIRKHKTPMQMNLLSIRGMIDDKEMTLSDEDLILALAKSKMVYINELHLSINPSYWRNPTAKRYLMDFIKA